MAVPVITLESNKDGRDIVIGDLHGMVNVLNTLLAQVGFDPRRDRVISVGDLIDRGAQNEQAIALLDEPWFFAVKGNHEQMLIDAVDFEASRQHWFEQGGAWACDLSQAQLLTYAKRLDALPYALEFNSGKLRVGVVHAEVPEGMSWQSLKTTLTTQSQNTEQARRKAILQENVMWSRTRFNNKRESIVEDIDFVVVGHSIVCKEGILGNTCYIDTGAYLAQAYNDNVVNSDVYLTAAIIKNGAISFHRTRSFSVVKIPEYSAAKLKKEAISNG